jgi:hypothetical protein
MNAPISETTENEKMGFADLLSVKLAAEQRIKNPANPPWVCRACEDLAMAINTVIAMVEVPPTRGDLLGLAEHQETALPPAV